MNNPGWNMYVFRDGKRSVCGATLISTLAAALERWQRTPEDDGEDAALAALVAAGELECALLDSASCGAASGVAVKVAAEITESLAHALLTGRRDSLSLILENVERLRPAVGANAEGVHYDAAVQEGFAYYALHPRKVAILLETLTLRPKVRVVGIRSIGVTLSAVASAALRLRGIECRRITVRPVGHPYDRELNVTHELRAWVAGAGDADFLVVDEGPGISGSSFLAVGEALTDCGVETERIQLVGSREVVPATLRASNACERWVRFQYHVIPSAPLAPARAGDRPIDRRTLWHGASPQNESTMPASWAPLEPVRFLARDGRSLFCFEGFGHYGEVVGRRSALLAAHGFAPPYLGGCRGFGEYKLVAGRTLEAQDRSPEVLERMATYLALRSKVFASDTPQTPELEKMLRWNWQLEFGEELSDAECRLRTERVVVCDGRMMPHEWLRSDDGKLLKLNAGTHGDNHFFPGACDIAWDVAGALVEWELEGELRRHFLSAYEARTGDAIQQRLPPYILAYTVFRLGWSRMAAAAMQGSCDEPLLERDYARYRAQAMRSRESQAAAELAAEPVDAERVSADETNAESVNSEATSRAAYEQRAANPSPGFKIKT
jgi:hypothetical protein